MKAEKENLGLSREMLEITRLIVKKNLDNTTGIADIGSSLVEVLVQRVNLNCVMDSCGDLFFNLFAETKGALLTKSTQAQTESIKCANVIPTSPECNGKRHQKVVDILFQSISEARCGILVESYQKQIITAQFYKPHPAGAKFSAASRGRSGGSARFEHAG